VPLEGRETPFIEVLLADSFCSLAKPLYQVIMGMVMLVASTGVESPDWNSLQAGSKARSVIPYIFWALPFYLRARQTIISAVASEGPKRVTHGANFVKYSLNFFVIFFAFQWASSMNAGITGNKTGNLTKEENQASASENALSMDDRASETMAYEAMWIIASVINEIYTVMWDICMDWGLGGRPSALRGTLLFPRKWYYVAIVIDFVGRSLWSARFSSLVMNHMGGVELVMASECYEVARRLMWVIFRIEWELIKTKHHIPAYRKSELTHMTVSTKKTSHERLSEMGPNEETERLSTLGYDDGFGRIGRSSYSSTDNIELKNQHKTTNILAYNAWGPRTNPKNLSYSLAKVASSLRDAVLWFNKPVDHDPLPSSIGSGPRSVASREVTKRHGIKHDYDDDDHGIEEELELQELIPSLNGFNESLSTASLLTESIIPPRCIGVGHAQSDGCCDHPSIGGQGTSSMSSCPLHARQSPSLSPPSTSRGGTRTTFLVPPKRNEEDDEENGITRTMPP